MEESLKTSQKLLHSFEVFGGMTRCCSPVHFYVKPESVLYDSISNRETG